MRISDILKQAKAKGRPVFSFEFFPPKNADGAENLKKTILSLKPLQPDFCSVTYGAGGSTRKLTVELVSALKHESGVVPMAHLTCVDANKDELRAVLTELKTHGIENVLALRGDPPKGTATFNATPGGYRYGHELAALAHDEFGLCTGGAVYPEGHVETRDAQLNIEHTRQKLHAGCEFFITQLFFEPRHYFEFVARLRAAGIYTPVLAGVMPITEVAQVERFTKLCGANIPDLLKRQLDDTRGDPLATMQLGIAYATQQCVRLIEGGAPGIHFYTLNRSASTRAILSALRAWYP